ncbi:MAG TPA: hypothetical protein VFI31_26525 [Pirellulales bacterium]|nr:hypothetical protein [Pirellulales bacterium]
MWLTLCLTLSAGALMAAPNDEADEATVVVHFALIHPEADPAAEATQLSPGAVWLRRPNGKKRKTGTAAITKRQNTPPKEGKPAAQVTPLRRERPKNEVDPPKTRRRQLGW